MEGAASEGDGPDVPKVQTHLRLSIRSGYINLYRDGQSVAKIGLNRKGKIHAKIHNKYVGGDKMKEGYTTLTHAGFKDPATGQLVCYEGRT
jgi:hypothetical protein